MEHMLKQTEQGKSSKGTHILRAYLTQIRPKLTRDDVLIPDWGFTSRIFS